MSKTESTAIVVNGVAIPRDLIHRVILTKSDKATVAQQLITEGDYETAIKLEKSKTRTEGPGLIDQAIDLLNNIIK